MKRHLLIIAICLLLGAVVNVAVAWGCALLSPASARNVFQPIVGYFPPANSARAFRHFFHRSSLRIEIPSGRAEFIHEWGLPLVSMWSKSTDVRHQVILPWRPLWPGFIVNTIIYAALLWPLIGRLFNLRGFLRVRRGLCAKCAYPTGESSVCTECGCELPKRARTS